MLDPDWYRGREQTYVKHFVLEKYLEKLAYKVGSWCHVVNYVDCFAGPWRQSTENLEDTSPYIALAKLKEVQEGLRRRNMEVKFRCLFIEKDPAAFDLLRSMLAGFEGIEAEAINGEFEGNSESIRRFCTSPRAKSFNFFFVDPTGWTGFPMDLLGPLMQLRPSEVLINFMTQHISRFIDAEVLVEHRENFRRLFGDEAASETWRDLRGFERERAMVETYARQVRSAGNFEYVATSLVLNPLRDRTHFHLIYATRHREGLSVFRNDAEKPALQEQNTARMQAFQRHEVERTRQMQLDLAPARVKSYLDELRDFSLDEMRQKLRAFLVERRRVGYEQLEVFALQLPFVHSKLINDWLFEQRELRNLNLENLKPRQTLKAGRGQVIVWIGSEDS